MNNINRFYSIIEEKQSEYKNVFEFLRTFISSEKEVGYTAKTRDKDVEVGQEYLLKIDSTQNTTEEERLRKLKRKLKREMHLEKSWGI